MVERVEGIVYSWTKVIHNPVQGINAPAPFVEPAPYIVALVRLPDRNLILAQLTDLEEEEVTYIDPDWGTTRIKKFYPQLEDENVKDRAIDNLRVEEVTRIIQSGGESGVILYGVKFRPVLETSEASKSSK